MLGVPVCANCACGFYLQSRQDNIAEAHFNARVEHSSEHWPASLWTRYVNNKTCGLNFLFILFMSASVSVVSSQLLQTFVQRLKHCLFVCHERIWGYVIHTNWAHYYRCQHRGVIAFNLYILWTDKRRLCGLWSAVVHIQTAHLAMSNFFNADFLDMDFGLSIND